MTDGQFEQLEIRLHNWGRWANGGRVSYVGGGAGHCGSAEYRYRAPKLADDEVASHRIPAPVDTQDAQTIEVAIRSLRCLTARKFLLDQYVKGISRPTLERQYRIHGNLYLAYRRRIAEMVREALRAIGHPELIRRGSLIWAGVARCGRSAV